MDALASSIVSESRPSGRDIFIFIDPIEPLLTKR
jgi:hypothetical protein